MDAFWGITFLVIILRFAMKSEWLLEGVRELRPAPKTKPTEEKEPTGVAGLKHFDEQIKLKKAQEAIDQQKERDRADLRKKGYSEEVIAVILPTINNGQ